MTPRRLLPAAALLLGGTLLLGGCAAVEGLVHKQSTQTFEDADAFRADASVDADWVPHDATALTLRTSTIEDADDAALLLTSTMTLPEDCVETVRTSAPTWTLDDAPSAYEAKTVFVCGDWSVIPSDDGWFGWTPNSDEEKAASRS
ncbi:hypothetical protein [Zhihengliuella sp. ISTPL4]|uniref:hypothetical protein n=1 Tax=Zhihengliuella sp. ISTPL4 TaxID=2058657 RepID=UPI0013054433|nr:hypothetical protein [Zhihengliuella sp. ISTPL4]